MVDFTFHYGSIQIATTLRNEIIISTLHSTMVLFKLLTTDKDMDEIRSLHSTMVLFKFGVSPPLYIK